MKKLNNYILEKLKINKNTVDKFLYKGDKITIIGIFIPKSFKMHNYITISPVLYEVLSFDGKNLVWKDKDKKNIDNPIELEENSNGYYESFTELIHLVILTKEESIKFFKEVKSLTEDNKTCLYNFFDKTDKKYIDEPDTDISSYSEVEIDKFIKKLEDLND